MVYNPMSNHRIKFKVVRPTSQHFAAASPGSHTLQGNGESGRIVPEPDGSFSGSYGPFILKTALQPIFGRPDNGRIELRGLEALLRIFRGDEPFSTADFFARIGDRERLSLDALCRSLHLANAAADGNDDVLLFLNLNPALFADSRTVLVQVGQMVERTRQHGFQTQQIVCEITEHHTSNPDLLTLLVDTLRERGFRIAVDDFGAAGSDSQRVDQIRPDIVKLDADWVKRLMHSDAGFESLRTSVARFQRRGAKVVMEGLEHDWQVELGWGSGTDLMQGYGLARPKLAPTDFCAQYAETVG